MKNIAQQFYSIFQGASVFVGSAIRVWRQKLADQVPVPGVNLDTIEPGRFATRGRIAESLHVALDLRHRQRPRPDTARVSEVAALITRPASVSLPMLRGLNRTPFATEMIFLLEEFLVPRRSPQVPGLVDKPEPRAVRLECRIYDGLARARLGVLASELDVRR